MRSFKVGDNVIHTRNRSKVYTVSRVLSNGDFYVLGYEDVGPERPGNYVHASELYALPAAEIAEFQKAVDKLRRAGYDVTATATRSESHTF